MTFIASYATELMNFTPAQLLTSLQVGLNMIGSSGKACFTFAYIRRFHKAKLMLDEMDKRVLTKEDWEPIHHWISRCNKIYMLFQTMYSGYGFSTYLGGALSGRLPWKLYNPFLNWEGSLAKFWLACTMEYGLMVGSLLQGMQSDVSPPVYFSILRVHIGLLKKRLSRLRTNPKLSEQQNYAELINCIKDHRLILDYCNNLRPVISGTIFLQFLLIGVSLGLSLINIMFFWDMWNGIPTIVYIFGLLMETFPFCYICNSLRDDVEELSNSLFQSNWMGAGRQYQSTVVHFLHNIQQPLIFTAGGIFEICMHTNINMARLAFSVITIVKQMNLAERFQE